MLTGGAWAGAVGWGGGGGKGVGRWGLDEPQPPGGFPTLINPCVHPLPTAARPGGGGVIVGWRYRPAGLEMD